MMRNTSPTAKFRLNRLATLAILPFRKITANKRRFPRAPNTKTLDSHVTRMIWPVEEFISPKTEGLLFFYTCNVILKFWKSWLDLVNINIPLNNTLLLSQYSLFRVSKSSFFWTNPKCKRRPYKPWRLKVALQYSFVKRFSVNFVLYL